MTVANDTFAVLRAGTERGWGVAVVCGAGINCVGVGPDGRHVRFPALGAISGDWGGGYDVGLAALSAAVRSEDGRGPRTGLERAVPAHFGLATPGELVEAIHLGRIPQRRIVELPPLVFEAAGADPVAAAIVDRLAAEVLALVGAAIQRLELDGAAVEVLLGGGMFRTGDGRLLGAIEAGCRRGCGGARGGVGADRRRRAARARRAGRARPERARTRHATSWGRSPSMAEVRFEQATRTYPGSDTPAVDALDLEIADGELMVLVGPSGSGKTTALRMLAGLEEVDAGTIRIGGRDVSDEPPKRRDVAMVFQNYALYPYLTVAANIGFPLRMARVPKADRDARVRKVAELLELTPYLERKPGQLSGGQRQRVAMGRAIVREPQVFLMDEPLSNLDAKLRVQMRADIAELQARLGITTVYVTHDQAEAMTLGHRVAVLRDAQLQQCDTPRALFDRPVNTFVAGFVGSPAMNLCRLPVGDDGAAAFGGLALTLPGLRANGRTEVIVGVRPEAMELADEGVEASVDVIEELGSDAFLFCGAELGGAHDAPRRAGRGSPRAGARRARAAAPQPRIHAAPVRRPQRRADWRVARHRRSCATSTSAPCWRRSARARRSRAPRSRAGSASPSRPCR